MAKKNLASLMSGIIGEDTPASAKPVEVTPAVEETNITEEKEEGIETEEAAPAESATAVSPAPRRRGRPRKGEKPVKVEEVRATFIVDPEHVRKMKYISLVEDNLLKDVIGAALQAYIDAWEAENGRIRLPKK